MVGVNDFSVEVKYGDRLLDVHDDGFLGKFDDRFSFLLEVTVRPGINNIYGFTVDGKKQPKLKRNTNPKGKRYKLKIPVVTTDESVYYTLYPHNNLRLLQTTPSGMFEIWEIAIVSQGGRFFLTSQITWKTNCYRDGNQIVCPELDNWPQLIKFLSQFFRTEQLTPVTKFRPRPKPTSEGLKPHTGRVLWYNQAQGVGALMTSEGQARVHWSQIRRNGGLVFLNPDEIVNYAQLREPAPGRRKTTFRREAVGVSLAP